jgi:hypothetical protein
VQEQRDGKRQRLNPIIFEPMVMSILLARQKRICEIENRLNEIYGQAALKQAAILNSQELSSEFLNV